MKKISFTQQLILLFFLSLAVRVVFFIFVLNKGIDSWVVFDSQQYHEIAQNIAVGNGLLDGKGALNFYRLPGYPLFLGLLHWLFNGNLSFILLVQIMITSLIPVALMILTSQLFPRYCSMIFMVGLFSALHVGFILYSGMLATEALFTLFFLLFCISFFKIISSEFLVNYHYLQCHPHLRCHPGLDPGSKGFSVLLRHAILAGLWLGCASLIRPVGHYMLVAAIVLLLIMTKYTFLNKIKIIAVMSLSWLSVVGWWLLRNWVLTGYLFFHTLPGLHFLQYSAANTYMVTHNVDYLTARANLLQEWQVEIKQQERAQEKRLNDYEQCLVGEELALKHCKNNLLASAKYSIVQFCKTMCSLYSSHLLLIEQGWVVYDETTTFLSKVKRYLIPQTQRWYIIPFIYADILTTVFVLISFLFFLVRCLYRRPYWLLAYQLLPFIMLFVGLTVAYGCARLRLPIEPLLLIITIFVWTHQCVDKPKWPYL